MTGREYVISRYIEDLLVTLCCCFLFGRVVVSLTNSPFPFSILLIHLKQTIGCQICCKDRFVVAYGSVFHSMTLTVFGVHQNRVFIKKYLPK